MFGDEKLFGQRTQILDGDHNRLALCVETKREPGEILVLIKDEDKIVFRLYSANTITKLYDELNEKILNAKTMEEINFYKDRVIELSKTIIRKPKVDTSGRVVLGSDFDGIEKVNVIGACDHLILELKK